MHLSNPRCFGCKPAGTMDVELDHLRKSFSFKEPCLRKWETSRGIRQRGILGKSLLDSDGGGGRIAPSLINISLNYHLLKGFTGHMAETGVICTRLLEPLKPPVEAFYALMEIDTSSEKAKSMIHATACTIKKMLTNIRLKWMRWEMPRVSFLN